MKTCWWWILLCLNCLCSFLPVADAIVNQPFGHRVQRDCGAPIVDGVISPRAGTVSKACWQVALVNSQLQYVCSGALIAPSWVLVPAHCLYRNVLEREVFQVLTSVEADQNVTNTQKRKVVRRYIHHMHSEQLLDHDIALIKLETPVELNVDTCFACLPSKDRKLGERAQCLASGFVFKVKVITPENPFFVQEAMLSIDDQTSSCQATAKSIPASSFCIFFRDAIARREHVQSRSVLACRSPADGRFEITGLLIKGVGYERNNVFIEVANYVDWIKLRLTN